MIEAIVILGVVSPLYIFTVTLYYKLGKIEGKIDQILNGKT